MSELATTSRLFAERLDLKDPLASFRDEFVIVDDSLCYLDGNSLGRLPRATIDVVNRYLSDEWGNRLVDGWNDWIDEAQSTGDLIGRAALGAGPGQVLAVDTTSVNFYQLCHAAVRARPGRRKVITDRANFPTDRYILEGLCDDLDLDLIYIDDETGEEFVTPAALADVVDNDTALVTLSVIQYRSGALHRIPELTEIARKAGALFVWDASHAVGVVPMAFDRDGVDLAVGCTYKYGNSGAGSPAWLYVRSSIQDELEVPIQGWFAQRDQFAMSHGFERARTIRGFQIASPSIIGLRCVQTAFSMIERATLPAIAQKAAIGTQLMVDLHDEWLAPLGCSLITPRDAHHRGGHVTIRHSEARKISLGLREFANVIGDYRQPDCIRLAISPLATSYVEVWEGFSRLRELIATGKYSDATEPTSRVT